MKKILFVALVSLMTGCSSSRYAAHFQYYKTNNGFAGRNSEMKPGESVITPIEPEKLVASTHNETARVTAETPSTTLVAAEQVRKTYFQMSKVERKNLRKALKSALKNNTAIHSANPASSAHSGRQWWQGWDQDLKLAAIFGAIGTVAFIIYTEPFWIIAAAALIIGLVFFIKWFVRQ
jgi:hypothetical protein